MCGYFGTDPLLLPAKPKYEAHWDPGVPESNRNWSTANHAYRVGSGECRKCRELEWLITQTVD